MKTITHPFSYHTKILKNGARHPQYKILNAVDNIVALRSSDPVVFFELVKKCRFANHELPINAAILLSKRGLLKNNDVDDVTRDVILSSVTGRLLGELEVTSPICDGRVAQLLT